MWTVNLVPETLQTDAKIAIFKLKTILNIK